MMCAGRPRLHHLSHRPRGDECRLTCQNGSGHYPDVYVYSSHAPLTLSADLWPPSRRSLRRESLGGLMPSTMHFVVSRCNSTTSRWAKNHCTALLDKLVVLKLVIDFT